MGCLRLSSPLWGRVRNFGKIFVYDFSHVFYRPSSVSFSIKEKMVTLRTTWFIDFHVSSRGKKLIISSVQCPLSCRACRSADCQWEPLFFDCERHVTFGVYRRDGREWERHDEKMTVFSCSIYVETGEWGRTGKRFKKKNLIFVHRKGNRNGPIWESVVEFDICYSSWRPGFFFLLSVSWCAEATTLSGNYLSRNGFQKEEEISHVRIFHRAISCAAARQRTSEPNS